MRGRKVTGGGNRAGTGELALPGRQKKRKKRLAGSGAGGRYAGGV
jgi:hypothetical protein